MDNVPLSPSEFVAITNQVLETAYPLVTIEGELSEFKVSKNRWVFLKLKDEESVVDFFGTVYQLKQPLEDGMMVRVTGRPKLSPKYGFSVNIEQITPVGEGAIRRAFDLLKAKLDKEGLFDEAKKRPIPARPRTIGLISSRAAAGATDFLTILRSRWGGIEVKFAEVPVQGEYAPEQIARAVDYFNELSEPVDVLVLVRGGGSLEDLMAFNTETVARAVAGSRSPTVVGVGHEDDVSLADLAADARAATPTHAAAMVVPDKQALLGELEAYKSRLNSHMQYQMTGLKDKLESSLKDAMDFRLDDFERELESYRRSLKAYDPQAALKRGYSVLSRGGKTLSSVKGLKTGVTIEAILSDGQLKAEVNDVKER